LFFHRQDAGKTSQDKELEVANEGAYTLYVTEFCNFLQRSKTKIISIFAILVVCGVLTHPYQ
jgi:hypothetical protein